MHTSSRSVDTSYQSGGIPTFNTSVAGGAGAAEDVEGQTNQWETRYGMRVDVLAAVAYLLGPISGVWNAIGFQIMHTLNVCLALALLVTETQNDYVRFHGWSSSYVIA